jgi:hypothetical protein
VFLQSGFRVEHKLLLVATVASKGISMLEQPNTSLFFLVFFSGSEELLKA